MEGIPPNFQYYLPERKSNTGIIIAVVIGLFVLLAVGGAIAYFVFGRKLLETTTPTSTTSRPTTTVSPTTTPSTTPSGATGSTAPPTPSPAPGTSTYLYISTYATTTYPSYVSLRTISGKRYLVPTSVPNQDDSIFDTDASGALTMKDLSTNKFTPIGVNKTSGEVVFLPTEESGNEENINLDNYPKIYYNNPNSSNKNIFNIGFDNPSANTISYLSIVRTSFSGVNYDIFKGVNLNGLRSTLVKKPKPDPIKPIYFPLSSDTTIQPKYLELVEKPNVLSYLPFRNTVTLNETSQYILKGSNFCYLNLNGNIFNPNCQFYLDTCTMMLIKAIEPNKYRYMVQDGTPTTFKLTSNISKKNVSFESPNKLFYDSTYLCSSVVRTSPFSTSTYPIKNVDDTLTTKTTSCTIGNATQTPLVTKVIDLETIVTPKKFLRNKTVTSAFVPYLVLEESATPQDYYFIKQDESDTNKHYLMVYKDGTFKYMDLDEEGGIYNLLYRDIPSSSKSIQVIKDGSTTNLILRGMNTSTDGRCLISKPGDIMGETFNYLSLRGTNGLNTACIRFKIVPYA